MSLPLYSRSVSIFLTDSYVRVIGIFGTHWEGTAWWHHDADLVLQHTDCSLWLALLRSRVGRTRAAYITRQYPRGFRRDFRVYRGCACAYVKSLTAPRPQIGSSCRCRRSTHRLQYWGRIWRCLCPAWTLSGDQWTLGWSTINRWLFTYYVLCWQ